MFYILIIWLLNISVLSVRDESYFTNTSCALNLISTFLLITFCISFCFIPNIITFLFQNLIKGSLRCIHRNRGFLHTWPRTYVTLPYNNKYGPWSVFFCIITSQCPSESSPLFTWRYICGRSTADCHMYPEHIMQEFENKTKYLSFY